MNPNRPRPQTDEMPVTQVLPPLRLPDASSAAAGMLDRALVYCAEEMHLDTAETALDLLREGQQTARWYAHHSLAEQVAESLGDLDANIQSVFVFDLDGTPGHPVDAEPAGSSPIHMIIRTKRTSDTPYALVRAMEWALIDEYASRVGPGQLECLLDVQVIGPDDDRVRRGYSGLLGSLYNRPIQVWQRERPQDAISE